MKLKNVNELKGGEYLCKPVCIGENTVLIYENTCLKEEYIKKLKELGVQYVYIKDEHEDIQDEEEIDTRNEISNDYFNKVKSILERHVYTNKSDLKEIRNIAYDLIEDIIEQDEIVERLENLRIHEPDIYEHTMTVCALSVVMALRMQLEKEIVYNIAVGSILHDIGFRYIPNLTIQSNLEKYSRKELMEYKKHTVYGYMAVQYEDWLSSTAKDIILAHHERIDGSGYPLKSKELSLESQIVSICDEYDCMICGMGYEPIKSYQIIEYFKTKRGISFDEKLVDVFMEFIAMYPNGSIVKLNTGEQAIVIRQNEGFKDRPVIKKITDSNSNGVTSILEIDMIKNLSIFITDVIE